MSGLPAWQRLAIVHAGRAWVLVLGLALLLAAGSVLRWWRLGAMFWPMVLAFVLAGLAGAWARWQRERLVREGALPQFLKRKLREAYPQLSAKDAELVERGLRQFFLACLRSQKHFVAMPSKVVDAMWHEFILHTRAYRDWCDLALGRFLHHTPAEALGTQARVNDGLRRAWYWACRDEAIQPAAPTRLPLLFALDAKLAIAGGYAYLPDCAAARAQGDATWCGTDLSDGGYAGDADGFGGMDSSGGDGDGGCGGD